MVSEWEEIEQEDAEGTERILINTPPFSPFPPAKNRNPEVEEWIESQLGAFPAACCVAESCDSSSPTKVDDIRSGTPERIDNNRSEVFNSSALRPLVKDQATNREAN